MQAPQRMYINVATFPLNITHREIVRNISNEAPTHTINNAAVVFDELSSGMLLSTAAEPLRESYLQT